MKLTDKIKYQISKFIHNVYSKIKYKWIDINGYFVFKKEIPETKIAVIYLRHIYNHNSIKRNTILFSHGNSSTLGHLYPFLFDLITTLKCNVISYDYSGYGESTGSSSEKVIYSDIKTVWAFMTDALEIKDDKVILMGYGLGSAPTVELGIQKSCEKIRRIILLSPIASGVSILIINNKTKEKKKQRNVLCNRLKVTRLKCPVFFIHGVKVK